MAGVVPRIVLRCVFGFELVNVDDEELLGVLMNDDHMNYMSWNIRGLNCPARRSAIREVVQAHRISVLCLQETKVESWSSSLACEVGGPNLQGCIVLPAIGTRGGAAIFWDKLVVNITSHRIG